MHQGASSGALGPKGFFNHSEFGAMFKKENSKVLSPVSHAASQSKIEVEKQKDSIQSEFREQNQFAFGERRGLIEALEYVKTNPARWSLINSSAKCLLGSYKKQWELSKNIQQVNSKFSKFKQSPEAYQVKALNQQLHALSLLNQEIEELSKVVFDSYCELTSIVIHSGDLDALYEFYMQLKALARDIAEEILNLNVTIDQELAA